MNNKQKMVLEQYVTDMTSLCRHIVTPVKQQAADAKVAEYPEALQTVKKVETVLEKQIRALEDLEKEFDPTLLSSLKEAATNVSGFLTGLYEKIRNDAVSKILRDDYTALTLACEGYSMLHTTGLALKNEQVAALALHHLKELTPLVMEIGQLTPAVVVKELISQGKAIDSSVIGQAERNVTEAWKASSRKPQAVG